jgi:hypothetical protein
MVGFFCFWKLKTYIVVLQAETEQNYGAYYACTTFPPKTQPYKSILFLMH